MQFKLRLPFVISNAGIHFVQSTKRLRLLSGQVQLNPINCIERTVNSLKQHETVCFKVSIWMQALGATIQKLAYSNIDQQSHFTEVKA